MGTIAKGYVYRSLDSGGNWDIISPGGDWVEHVRDIEAVSKSEVYAATDAGLLKWTGSGDVWTQLKGLPSNNTVSIALDKSVDPAVIYVGTWGAGVFYSRDGGETWLPFSHNIGNKFVYKLAMSSNKPYTLYAGTNFSGIWTRKLSLPGSPWLPLLLLDDQ